MRPPAGCRHPWDRWGVRAAHPPTPPLTCLLSLQIFTEGALPLLPSGAIAVNGRNVQTEAPSVRAELGTCPQRHVLFAPLPVLDHLLLFPSLKAPRGPIRSCVGMSVGEGQPPLPPLPPCVGV